MSEVEGDSGGAALSIGVGRDFSRLLFVTSAEALRSRIGKEEAALALRSLRATGARVEDGIPDNATAAIAIEAVQGLIRGDAEVEGVVILGGHDVVPHQLFDCLPPDLRSKVKTYQDGDDFRVWSDAGYGRRDPAHIQDVPVSRIPDCHLSAVVFASLQAVRTAGPVRWSGIRNKLREFADQVFSEVSPSRLLISHPVNHRGFPPACAPPHLMATENVYIMLHGHHTESDKYKGNLTPSVLTDAFFIDNVPEQPGQVIFTGCCWGALTTTVCANDVYPGRPLGIKQPATSIAMRFIANGALAFIGCTGMHWSPCDNVDSAGGAMHLAFFRRFANDVDRHGAPIGPALALFRAKLDYRRDLPHGADDDDFFRIAVEYKTLHQYICLGLGW